MTSEFNKKANTFTEQVVYHHKRNGKIHSVTKHEAVKYRRD